MIGKIAAKGVPAPIQIGKHQVMESTQAWMNGYGKIRRCFERDGRIVDFHLYRPPPSPPSAHSSTKPAPPPLGHPIHHRPPALNINSI
ncbi:hypothetical protein ABH935_009853 [Catenulispora sp. GAS73]